ncbi:MAG: hypothetical protein KC503_41120 [Myxococcales bacterium]|nr:hypothetical protein [Myxococcales bacterium]
MKRVTLTFTIVATLLASASTARADAGPKLPREAFYISPGLTLGGTSSFDVGTGFTLGGEISLLYWNNARYVGAVVDALYDWKRDGGRMMFGAEVGFGPFGIDGGYLLELREGGPYHGVGVRLFAMLGIFGVYLRYGGIIDLPDYLEWGLLIKVPFPPWAKYPRRGRRGPRPPATRSPAAQPPATRPASQPMSR